MLALLLASLGIITVDGSIPRVGRENPTWVPTFLQATLNQTRRLLLGLASPVYAVAEAPYQIAGFVHDVTADRADLLEQRDRLSERLLLLEQRQQRFDYLQQENTRLRQLLGSGAQLPSQVTIAEIVGVSPNPQRDELLLDKGSDDGVAPGQAVLDAQGVFGQVVEVAASTSWVLLITDRNHAMPVRNSRTGVRMIVAGTGLLDTLILEDLPASTDIQEGDLIETSGLGGRFPIGYPVGTVATLGSVQDSPYLSASLKPKAALSKVGHVLIVAEAAVDAAPTQPTATPAEGQSSPSTSAGES